MRFMLMVIPKGYENAAPGTVPRPDAVARMMEYNKALHRAGVLLALDGLMPPSTGARVVWRDSKATVTDGPFAEAKEVVGGYWIVQVRSREEDHRNAWLCSPNRAPVASTGGPPEPSMTSCVPFGTRRSLWRTCLSVQFLWPRDFVAAHAAFAVAEHPHRRQLNIQTERRILKDHSDFDAELLPAGVAFPPLLWVQPIVLAPAASHFGPSDPALGPAESGHNIDSGLLV